MDLDLREEFHNKTPPHPNHVKHAERRSTGGRCDRPTVVSYYGSLSKNRLAKASKYNTGDFIGFLRKNIGLTLDEKRQN